jgi:uncharacterized SAM-binding protein YcdF (DUF218 family)/glycosyltransferase involved in cell wall biosynthesis
LLRGRDVICISSIDWDTHWQIHQQIAWSLVAAGNRVLFVENTGVRSAGVRDLSRLRQRVRNWWRSTKGFREVQPGLFVFSPVFLPFPYSALARWFNRTLLFRTLRRWMAAAEFSRPIVWTFLPTPLAQDLIREVEASLVVYYCADDFAATSPGARRVERSEVALFRQADLVFVTAERLREKAARWSRAVHAFPAGVEFSKFERVRTGPVAIPPDLARLQRPIAGYVGALHMWMDQELLAEVASAMPDVSFAFVGPPQVDMGRIARLPNVSLLGAKPHDEIPAYVKGFDVALVPYRRSEFTDSVYPVKLNEYLAMGVPIVATALPEVERFNARHGGVVSIADTAPKFAAAIRHSLNGAAADQTERRVAAARANSWERRLAEMSVLIEGALERRRAREHGWERRFQRLYRVARRRALETAAAILLVFGLLFYSPLVWLAAEPLHLAEPPSAADAIVVFAGGVGESGQAGGGYQERVKQAVDLYHAQFAPRLIFSSGYVFAFQEAEIMKSLAVANGVPEPAIILEKRAASTHDNVRFVNDILAREGWRKILLVSSPYHMRRALLTWRGTAPDVTVVPTPVPQSQFYAHSTGASLEQIRGILQEYAAIVGYWLRGWFSPDRAPRHAP